MSDTPTHSLRTAVAATLLALAAAGCAMTFDSTSLGVSASMAAAASQPVAGDTFKVTTHALYAFWGLVPLREPDLLGQLQGQLAGGQAVQNLRIHVRRRLPDVLVTALTLGLVSPVSVTFRGVITGSQ